ncbi:MAG: hypothetical protein KGH52_02450 [Candidatus Micrarchaeota archaeon]|nr:hypothetical protein [Candidatus Micrarchaeota archaeon]
MPKWDPKGDASKWWYVVGLFSTIGNVIAIIYVLLSDSRKKLAGVLYIVGFFGPLVVYLIAKKDDHKLANLSFKLMIGNLIASLIIATLIIIFAIFVFNTVPLITNQCIFPSGFNCLSSIFHENGTLQFNIRPSFTGLINITSVGCSASTIPTNMQVLIPPRQLLPGDNISLEVRCYNRTVLYTSKTGSFYEGYIFVNYTDSTGFPHSVIGTFRGKVT